MNETMIAPDANPCEALTRAIERFAGTADRAAVTDEKILEFLDRTAATEIAETTRLLRLADHFDVGELEEHWLSLRRIYEIAMRRDPENANIRLAWAFVRFLLKSGPVNGGPKVRRVYWSKCAVQRSVVPAGASPAPAKVVPAG